MKRNCWLVLLLLGSSVAFAQAGKPASSTPQAQKPAPKPAPPAQTAPTTPPAAEVAPTAAVITIDGLCQTKSASGECKTVITRAQFDQLIDALAGLRPEGQPIPPQAKRQFAQQYARLLLLSTNAEKQGLEKSPDTQQLMQFARMQILAQEYSRVMQQKATPTAEEQQKYYNDNQKRYTQYTFDRLIIPLLPGKDTQTESQMKAFAEQLRQRAVKGEDFKTLEKEAYDKAGMQNPPEIHVVLQPESIPPTQQAVLQLKAGEVSQAMVEPSGIYIYKLVLQEQMPLDRVAPDIKATLQREKLQRESEALMNSIKPEFNPQYFGEMAPPPGLPGVPPSGPPATVPRPGTPPGPGTPKPPVTPPQPPPK